MKTELEKAAEKYCLINNIPIDQMIVKTDRSCEFETPITMFIEGAKWKSERMYSEEEIKEIINLSCEEGMFIQRTINDKVRIPYLRIRDFTVKMFEQFKKK